MLELTAEIASIAGLGFSIWAAVAAQGARSAARQATRAARERSAVDEFRRLHELARHLCTLLELEDWRGASVRVSDAADELAVFIWRRKDLLSAQGESVLGTALVQLQEVSGALAPAPDDVAPAKVRLLGMARLVVGAMGEELGRLQAGVDKE